MVSDGFPDAEISNTEPEDRDVVRYAHHRQSR